MPNNLRYLLIVALVSVFIMAGCLDEVFSPDSDCTLTVEKEGEGEVTPTVGRHRYEQDTVVVLSAFPVSGWRFVRWEGEVADPGSSQTTVVMESDRLVRAVFANGPLEDPDDDPPTYLMPTTPPPNDEPDDDDKPGDGLPPTPHPHPSARIHRIWTGEDPTTGTSYKFERDLWNCSGLEGTWHFRESLRYYGETSGVIFGETTFTMPPRPEEGPWESLPFTFTKSGTTQTGGGHAVHTLSYEDAILTLTTSGPFLTMATLRGHSTWGFVSYRGGHSVQAGPVSTDFYLGPFLVALVLHPECDPDFTGEPPDDELVPLKPLVPPEELPLDPPDDELPLKPLVPELPLKPLVPPED